MYVDGMNKLFISHGSADDGFVRDLRMALVDHGQDGWIDSRDLRGGDPLWLEIQTAIEEASAFAVVVSPEALQSRWVGQEVRHALKVQRKRGREAYPVIPLSLNNTKLGVLEELFGEEPAYIPVTSDAGGVEAAMDAILVALGERLRADVPPAPQPKAEPLEELVLELTDLKFHEEDGIRRASARARLIYEPATAGQREVASPKYWHLTAPIGPIEAEEMRWYLEKYAIWPSGIFRDRAEKVEENLAKWGQLLYQAAMPGEHTAKVMQAWAKVGDHAGRRFSVLVDAAVEAGASDEEIKTAKEAATELLRMPWELLHNSEGYLFQGAKPTRVRRRLPNTQVLDVPVVATPIRILLVTARPEDDACGYIDHRVSAMPLVEAMESLPGLVQIQVLNPPTLPALRQELDRARGQGQPYHVVHFDGHGVYDRKVGLGGLCFELPEDVGKVEQRRHVTVFTNELGSILQNYRIPLVFLEACETAQAEKASESVASELLKVGVASVVAMSHSVLVATASRFVKAFYQTLAEGRRVGDAMLEGQRRLKDDTFRGRIFGAGELRLQDWFVPVLFQEKEDPRLFKTTPARQTQEDARAALAARFGDLPDPPETGFIGRSRDLLALQRLLRKERYAVVRGQGGEGKTELAAELARWMVRSQQVHRAAFVSVEGLERNVAETVLDKLGHQLVRRDYSTQADCHGDLGKARQEIERALQEQPTLLVLDNMESILLPPFVEKETPEALSQEAREELKVILALCERLVKVGETRLVFTSREALPAPFDDERHRRELFQLDREDAVKLVERSLNAASEDVGSTSDAGHEEIEQLVEAVHCHARTLALLAPALRTLGVEATRASLVELMTEMERRFPGSRERSVFASVELSLRRMTKDNQERVRVLGVFHGGMNRGVLRSMMQWEEEDVTSLCNELVETGLATLNPYNHLTLNPALCPYLRGRMEPSEREDLAARWVAAMREYIEFLLQQQIQKTKVVARLTRLELANLLAVLDLMLASGDTKATISLATSLYGLLQALGVPLLLERVAQVRDMAATTLGETWNHTRFEVSWTQIEQDLAVGRKHETLAGARKLLEIARALGEIAYPGADYDLAMSLNLLGEVLRDVGKPGQALPLQDEALQRFDAIEKREPQCGAALMGSNCLLERGNCLLSLGRVEAASASYEESIRRAEQIAAERHVAAGKEQLGSVRLLQGRYQEALAAFNEARELFMQLAEPVSVALICHQIGMVYQENGQSGVAEDAFRESLALNVRLGDLAGQAKTLVQLGLLYDALGRTEEAVSFCRQAIEQFIKISDVADEGRSRSNLAFYLCKLRRLDEARQQVFRAIKCMDQLDHSSTPWKTWTILADIETTTGNPAAAVEANRKAIACYLAYRRDGGENHSDSGRLVFDMMEKLHSEGPFAATSYLQQLTTDPDEASLLPFIQALQAIVAGSRDRTIADAPDLHYTMAAEILLLIETLEESR